MLTAILTVTIQSQLFWQQIWSTAKLVIENEIGNIVHSICLFMSHVKDISRQHMSDV
jgi:hypothetical protein